MFQIGYEWIGHYYSQPGMSIGLFVESADAKHSTSAVSESDVARNAPSAASSDGELSDYPPKENNTYPTRMSLQVQGIPVRFEWK